MKKNVGKIDKIIRIIVAAILLILSLTKIITGVWSFLIIIISTTLLLTALINFCPLYGVCKINTKNNK